MRNVGGLICGALGALIWVSCSSNPSRRGETTVGATASTTAATGSTTVGTTAGATGSTTAGTSGGGSTGTGGTPCGNDLLCGVMCNGSTTTTVSGTVYDPAGNNALYGITVFVPAAPLTQLPAGVPTGNNACSCGALFPSGAVTNTVTDVDGKFTLANVPVGTDVPLVIQVGKWRRQILINVTGCEDNPQPDKSLTLPGTVAAGDIADNMPDIAVSTGSADTLECLLLRMGVSGNEYVAGTSKAGHIHIFSGGLAGQSTKQQAASDIGVPELNVIANAPASSSSLWSTQQQLMPYDIVLLSCEGGETYQANPPALEAYLNAGGRVFGSHYHYTWFSGPLGSTQGYTAPADWGSNLAAWTKDGGDSSSDIGGIIDTTLNGSTQPFAKGVILNQWLGDRGGLGGSQPFSTIPKTELDIWQPRYDAVVSAANAASQPWITSDSAADEPNQTMYFSFDTPINAANQQYCGRAVFSDLHVSGNPSIADTCNEPGFLGFGGQPAPAGCDATTLSPQEMALEFMIFDLSSCVISDTIPPQVDGGLPPPPS